jgi:Fe-S oxidoreductase
MLDAVRKEIETCTFCPKLCRTHCPVSNAEPKETLTPWGKMASVHMLGSGAVLPHEEQSFAAPAWACTGCGACKSSCDHKNDVAPTLGVARAQLFAQGLEPQGARRVANGFSAHDARVRAAVHSLGVQGDGVRMFLPGCMYVLRFPQQTNDALTVAQALVPGVSVVPGCCGMPLGMAGDAQAAHAHVDRLRSEVRGARELVVGDAGCAVFLRDKLDVPVTTLVQVAYAQLERFASPAQAQDPVRYHDPCQLSRGLSVYEEPRALLARVTGARPLEFTKHHEHGACAGGGGLLPSTMPEVSRGIAQERVREHEALGGGTVVTACASSLHSLQRAGAHAVDLASLLAASLGDPEAP